MGRGMKIKPKGNKTITFSKAEINEYNRKVKQAEQDLKLEMIEKMALLFTAYIMEDESINCDEDKIADMYVKLNEWAWHIEDHTITIKTVSDIIFDKTGIRVKWE